MFRIGKENVSHRYKNTMNAKEIEGILQSCLVEEMEIYEYPTDEEWKRLEESLDCKFCNEFKTFINLMSKYMFPGDIFNVKNENNNGNDTIIDVYKYECRYPEWDANMIPFYGIGNGDCFCLRKNDMKVYYFYEDRLEFGFYMETFAEWILDLPDFLE